MMQNSITIMSFDIRDC